MIKHSQRAPVSVTLEHRKTDGWACLFRGTFRCEVFDEPDLAAYPITFRERAGREHLATLVDRYVTWVGPGKYRLRAEGRQCRVRSLSFAPRRLPPVPDEEGMDRVLLPATMMFYEEPYFGPLPEKPYLLRVLDSFEAATATERTAVEAK